MATRSISLGLLLAIACTSCSAGDRYVVDRTLVECVRAMAPEERAQTAVSAVRASGGGRVFLRGSTLVLDALPSGDRITVEAHVASRLVTTASVLTWVGTALSLVGTSIFLSTWSSPNRDLHWAGGIVDLAGEGPMLLGTILWPIGLTRRHQEVQIGRSDLRYLSTAPANEDRQTPN